MRCFPTRAPCALGQKPASVHSIARALLSEPLDGRGPARHPDFGAHSQTRYAARTRRTPLHALAPSTPQNASRHALHPSVRSPFPSSALNFTITRLGGRQLHTDESGAARPGYGVAQSHIQVADMPPDHLRGIHDGQPCSTRMPCRAASSDTARRVPQ